MPRNELTKCQPQCNTIVLNVRIDGKVKERRKESVSSTKERAPKQFLLEAVKQCGQVTGCALST